MKKLVLILIAGVSFATAHAQIQFGVKAGANLSTFTGDDESDAKTLVGFNGGVFAKIPISGGSSGSGDDPKVHNGVFQLGLRYTLFGNSSTPRSSAK